MNTFFSIVQYISEQTMVEEDMFIDMVSLLCTSLFACMLSAYL